MPRKTNIVDGVGRGPNPVRISAFVAAGDAVVFPTDLIGVEQCGQAVMPETREDRRQVRLTAVLIDYLDTRRGVARTTSIFYIAGNLSGKMLVIFCPNGSAWRRGAREKELMRRETRPFIGLKHVVGKAVFRGDIKIRSYDRVVVNSADVGLLRTSGQVHLPLS